MAIDDHIRETTIMRIDLRDVPNGENVLAFTQKGFYRFEILEKVIDGVYCAIRTRVTGGPFHRPTEFIYQGAREDDKLIPGAIRVGCPMSGFQFAHQQTHHYIAGEVEVEQNTILDYHTSDVVCHIERQPAKSNVTPFRRIKRR